MLTQFSFFLRNFRLDKINESCTRLIYRKKQLPKIFCGAHILQTSNRRFCLFYAKRPTATRHFPCFLLSLFQVFPFTNDRENIRRTTNYKRPKIIMCFPEYILLVLAELRYISFRASKSTFCVSLLKSKTQRLSIEPYRNLPKRHPLD